MQPGGNERDDSSQNRLLTGGSPAGTFELPEAGTAPLIARFFVILAPTHLFADPTALDDLAKAADCLLDGFFFSHPYLNHARNLLLETDRVFLAYHIDQYGETETIARTAPHVSRILSEFSAD
jgi:hypothetical protein